MAAAAAAVDSLVKEYLVFRGFTATLRAFEVDVKGDKNKSFKVERVVEQFSSYIQNFDINGLKKYWRYYDKCFFCHLGYGTYKIVRKLETSLLRFYVIHAIQLGKSEKVNEFFEKYVTDLQHDDAWRDWFALPFMKNPEQNRTFSIYFTKTWQDTVLLSLANCFDTIFTHMALPGLLNLENEKREIEYLKEDHNKSKELIESLRTELYQLKDEKSLKMVSVSTQTNNEISLEFPEVDLNEKGKGKSPGSKPRIWKLLGSKEKETHKISETIKEKITKSNDNGKDSAKDTKLRNSMDESMFRKHISLTNAMHLKSAPKKTEKLQETSPISTDESNSAFYTSFDSVHTDALNSKQYMKSSSFPELPSNSKRNSDIVDIPSYYADSSSESPFIILSQNEFKEHTCPIVLCKFSENNNLVCSLDIDGIVKVWQCYPSVATTSTVSLKNDFASFDWIPNAENKLLLGRSNGQASLYDINQKKVLLDANISMKYKRITSVVCNPLSATSVCSAVSQSTEKKSNNKSQSQQKFIKLKEYTSYNSTSAKQPGCLTVLDLNTGQVKTELCLDPFPVCVHSLTFNHNGTLLLTGGADGMIRLFDIRNNDCLIGWHAHATNVLDVMFDPGETSMYSIGADGKVCVWDINKVSSKIAEFPLHASSTGLSYYSRTGDVNCVTDIPYSKLLECDADGQHLMTCGPSGQMIYKSKPKTLMEETMHILSPSSEVFTLDWTSSPNCSTAMCGTKKGNIQVSTLLKR